MHLIQQHSVSINCGNEQLGNQIKDELISLLQSAFYPKLDKLMENYNHHNKLWQIDYLPLSFKIDNAKNWKAELVEKSIYQIKLFLETNKPSQSSWNSNSSSQGSIQKVDKIEHIQKLFLTYLETGILEPNAISNKLEFIYKEVSTSNKLIGQLETTLKNRFQSILRWSLNVPHEIKLNYLELKNISHDLDFTKDRIEKNPLLNDFLEYLYWIGIFNKDGSALKEPEINELRKIARHYYDIEEAHFDKLLFVQLKQEKTRSKSKSDSKSVNEEQKELVSKKLESPDHNNNTTLTKYYITNAGLVILHPFMKRLFDSLGYLKKNTWKDIQTQHRAVLLLQYLINFNTEIFENDLLLNKLLCGVPVENTVNTKWDITKKEEEQCKALLNSVIKHWKVLKKTSIATLQESFFQRAAKIELNKNDRYEITVEQKSIDVLLDQLPWGIGMIKTPWMDDYLICNWN